MSDFPAIRPGEEVMPQMIGYQMACCDCCLVHTMNFRVVRVTHKGDGVFGTSAPEEAGLRIILSATRDDEATQVLRGRGDGSSYGRLKNEWRNALHNPLWWALVLANVCLCAYLWSLP